jgi:TRAP transporter 4TM/12TM fusion protein
VFGHLIPGFFNTFQPEFPRLISALSIGLSGVYGPLLSASANYIFLFIVLGSIIMTTPAHLAFTELSKLVAGRTRGGPGHMPVVSSAIVGMITGASSANIAITGAITIPPMKSAGYTADEAGAIEAVASHGGQIMPPVLGASAFVMAELTGIDYFDICVATAIPALIYFLSISFYVELRARKLNMVPQRMAVDYQKLMFGLPFVVVPIGLLIVLMYLEYSPNYAAFWTLVATFAVTYASKKTRPTFQQLIDSLREGATIGAMMTGVTAGLGMVMQVITSTGLSIKLPEFIDLVSNGNVWIGMFFLFIMSLVLGAGLPTLAVYLVLAIVTAPVLVDMGMSMMAVHLAILYFANYAGVTPPFAPGAMIAAKLAGGNWVRTANIGMLIGIPALFLPFLWTSNPALLADFSDPLMAAMSLFSCFLSVLLLNMLVTRYFLVELDMLQMALTLIGALGLCAAVVMLSYPIFAASLVPLAVVLIKQMKDSGKGKLVRAVA